MVPGSARWVAAFEIPQIAIACERSRCPELTGAPLAIVQDGKVICVSDEAGAKGVTASQTMSGARILCPSLVALPYDRDAYMVAVRTVWDLYALESSTVEPVSPELCFLVLEGTYVPERAQELLQVTQQGIGVAVRAGIARSKFVALHAARAAGDGGVACVPRGAERDLVAGVRLPEIPGLTPPMLSKLDRMGLRTLGDAAAVAHKLPASMRQTTHRLQQFAAGLDGETVKACWPPRDVAERIPFDDEVVALERIQGALRQCSDRVAARLRRDRQYCKRIALSLEFEDQSHTSVFEDLAFPTNEGDTVYRAALRLLGRLDPKLGVMSVTVTAGEMAIGSGQQLQLLDPSGASGLPHERASRLQATLTYILKKWGPRSIARAASFQRAKRIGLWTYPMGHLLNEPIQVFTTAEGAPVRYVRRSQAHDVERVQNRWREHEWHWGVERDVAVWRVQTSAGALSEIADTGDAWRLQGMVD